MIFSIDSAKWVKLTSNSAVSSCVESRRVETATDVYVHDFTCWGNRGGTSPLKVNPEVITPRRERRSLDRLRVNFLKRVFSRKRTSSQPLRTTSTFYQHACSCARLRGAFALPPFFRLFLSFVEAGHEDRASKATIRLMDTISIRHRDYLSQLFTPADLYRWSTCTTNTPFSFFLVSFHEN